MKKKLKVWDESCKDSHSEEFCYFRLAQHKDDVCLLAVDVDGKRVKDGAILFLDGDFNVVTLVAGISSDIPLKTDVAAHALAYRDFETKDMLVKSTRSEFGDLFARIMEKVAENDKDKPTMN